MFEHLLKAFEEIVEDGCRRTIEKIEKSRGIKIEQSEKDKIVNEVKKDSIQLNFVDSAFSFKPKRKMVEIDEKQEEKEVTSFQPPPPFEEEEIQPNQDAFIEEHQEFKVDEDTFPSLDDDGPITSPDGSSIFRKHMNLKVMGEICEPLPAFFWKPPKDFGNGYGEIYCTTEMISNVDWIVTILSKNAYGQLEIIGGIPASTFPQVISRVILTGKENFYDCRSLFISNLNNLSGYEYGCELLNWKGVKFGKATQFLPSRR